MTDNDRKPIGALLDARGVTARLEDGDMVTDAVVLMKVVCDDGGVMVKTVWSEGTTWFDRRALLEIGRDSETFDIGETEEDEE